MIVAHVVAVVLGVVAAAAVLVSALQTVVLPRHGFTRTARVVFAAWHRVLVHDTSDRRRSEERRALFAPVALVSLPFVWMVSVILAFTAIFWGLHVGSLEEAVSTSGSSITTLGFTRPDKPGLVWICFGEAIIGLGLVALLISYLPTIYAAYNQREKGVGMLVPVAGRSPSGVGLLTRMREARAANTSGVWSTIASWVIDLEQNHTSFPALCWFPSQVEGQSWVSTAGAVLDAAAFLASSATPEERGEGPLLVLAYGTQAMTRIGLAAGLPLAPPVPILDLLDQRAGDRPEVSVSRPEYEAAIDRLEGVGVLTGVDRARGWEAYANLRSGYDRAVRGLAGITGASGAPLTSDRPAVVARPRLFGNRPIDVDWTVPPVLPAPSSDGGAGAVPLP